jgi:hypothetical protein
LSLHELAVTAAGAISTATHLSSRANGPRLLSAEHPLSCICGSGIVKYGIHFAFQQVCPFSDVLSYGGEGFSFKASGGSYAKLFDGTEKMLSGDNILWINRSALLP